MDTRGQRLLSQVKQSAMARYSSRPPRLACRVHVTVMQQCDWLAFPASLGLDWLNLAEVTNVLFTSSVFDTQLLPTPDQDLVTAFILTPFFTWSAANQVAIR